MSRFAHLPLPVFSICLALLVGLSGLLGSRYLNQTIDQIEELEEQYHKDIVQTGAHLAAHLHELKQHINEKGGDPNRNERSFRSFGSLFLRHGEFDQLEIYSIPSCRLILKSTLDKSLKTGCFDSKLPANEFFWDQTVEGYPVMGLRMSIPDNPKISLAGKVVLDKEWAALHPLVAGSFTKLKLSLKQDFGQKPYLIAEDGYKPQTGYMANLWSQHWLLSLFPNRIVNMKDAFVQIQSIFLLFSIMLSTLALFSLKARLRVLGERKLDFFNWCKDLVQNTIHPVHQQKQRSTLLCKDDVYGPWCEELLQIKKEEQEKKSDFMTHFNEVNQENEQLKEKVKRLQEELSIVAENEALSYHICQNAPVLIEKHLNQKKLLKKITDHNQKDFLPVLKEFKRLFDDWSYNLEMKGSRKFLRSLCEVSGQRGSKHRLDENIEDFLKLGNHILNMAQNTDKIIGELFVEKDLSLKTLSYWSSLAFVEKDCKSMPMQMDEVCNYVGKLLAFEKRSWSGKIQLPEALKILKFAWIPNSVLIASFYHVVSLITTFSQDKKLDLVFHSKVKQDLSYMFITLAATEQNQEGDIFKPSSLHWKKVKHLLLPYGLDISYLPGRKDQATVSLSWRNRQKMSHSDSVEPKSRGLELS